MVLEYKFEYISNNENYIVFLDNILKDRGFEYKILKDKDLVFLYIEAEENELLEISNDLSTKLPMSIYLRNFTLEVVPQIPKKDYRRDTSSVNLTYCSNCVANIDNEYSSNFSKSFFSCNICGATCDVSDLRLYENETLLKFENSKEILKEVAFKLSDNKKIRIKTEYYDFVFKKFDKLNNEKDDILATNLEHISKLVVSSQEKNLLLTSVEKPTVEFNINEIYKRNNDISFEKVNISLAKDLFLYLLSNELDDLGIEFLEYNNNEEYDFELTYDFKENKASNLRVSMYEKQIFILENRDYDKRLDEIYNNFNEASKSQFMVLIDENRAYEKSLLNVYCSSKNNEQITLYSEKIDGMLDILNYRMPSSVEEIFTNISKSETGKRLLENYKEKFPKDYENAINSEEFQFTNSSITSLWQIAKLVLGFEDDILINAKKALLQKGPRVDYKLIESDKVYNKEFDLEKFIRSGISFKLAGVDEKSLALGYIESYAYFIADIVDVVNKEFELDGVSLSGDLIADEFVYKMLKKAITNNFKLFYNKDFPIQL